MLRKLVFFLLKVIFDFVEEFFSFFGFSLSEDIFSIGSTHIFDAVFFCSGENVSVEMRDILVGKKSLIDENVEFVSLIFGQLFINFSNSSRKICIFFIG